MSSDDQPPATERISIGFIPKAAGELRDLATLTGLSKADVVNRAVTVYSFIDAEIRAGNHILVRNGATGDVERIRLI